MEIKQKLKFINSGKQVLIKTANFYLSSKGFYPNNIELLSKLNYDDMVFKLYQVTNSDIVIQQEEMLCYEKEIAIQQKKSGKYISAHLEQDMWKFSLSSSLDPSCVFILKPLYKCQNANLNYVEFDSEIYITLSTQSQGQSFQDYTITIDKQKQQIELTANIKQSSISHSSFQFQEVEQIQSKQLNYGSIVKIKLIEKNAYLMQSNSLYKSSYFSEKFVPIWKSVNEGQEIFNFDLWKICHPDKFGQRLQNQDFFYLKNLAGNYYLSESSIVEVLNQASCYQIQDFQQNLLIGKVSLNSQSISVQSNISHDQLYYFVDYKENSSKKELIQFELSERIDVTINNWLNNISDLLIETTTFFKTHTQQLNEEKSFFDQLYLIQSALTDLIRFCFINGEQILIDQKSLFYYEPNKHNQNLIRSTTLIQCFLKFIEEAIQCFEIELLQQQEDDDTSIQEIKKVLKFIFIFFEALCNGNTNNGLLLINSYQQLLIRYIGMKVGAFSCLIRILQTNKSLLTIDINKSSGINQERLNLQSFSLIDQVIQKAKSIRYNLWPNLLRFLSSFCKCDDQICHENIKIICDQICFQDNFLLEIFPKEDMLLYVKLDGRFYEISQIYANQQNLELYNVHIIQQFLDQQLNLISNLSNGKLFEFRYYFQQQLPSSHLMSYICQKRINQALQSKVIQILLNLYIQWHPFYQKQLPKLIYQKNEMKINAFKQPFSKNEISFIEKLYDIVCEQLKNEFISQGRINLNQSMSQYLLLYYKISSLKKLNQNGLQHIIDDQNFLVTGYQNLNESLEQESSPLFEQFQESKNIFNEIANTFINYFSFMIDLVYNKQFVEAIRASQNSNNIEFEDYVMQKYQSIGYSTLELFNHKQLDPKVKIQSLILIEKVFQPTRYLCVILKNSIFLEKEWEHLMYEQIKKAIFIFKQILNAKKDLNLMKKGIDTLQQLQSLVKQSYEYRLVFVKIMQIMKFDQVLLDSLNKFKADCLFITSQLITQTNEQVNLINEEETNLQICQDIFIVLQIVCQKNEKFKYKILKQYQLSYLNCINIGQFDLLKEIYSDQYEIINSANESLILSLLENPKIESFLILRSLIEQHNIFFENNLILIMKHIQLLLNKFDLNDLMTMQFEYSQIPWKYQEKLGKYPYGYQLAFLNLIIKILQYATVQQRVIFKLHFSLPQIFQIILTLEEVYSIQINHYQQAELQDLVLNTIIKFHLLELLALLIEYEDIKSFFGDQYETLNRFISIQTQLLTNNIITFDLNELQKVKESVKFIEILQTKFQILNNRINQNSSKTFQFKQECANTLSKEFAYCFQFTNYVKLILRMSIKLGVSLQEVRNDFGESSLRSKSVRSFTSIHFKQKAHSNEQIEFGSQNNLYIDMTNDIEQLVLECEQYLIKNLEQYNGEDFTKTSQQFAKLFSRQLNIKGNILKTNQENQKRFFLQPTCVYDPRIHELIEIQKYNKSTLRTIQLNTLILSNVQEEVFQMYFKLFSKMNLLDSNFEFQVTNSQKFISNLIICLKTSCDSIQNYYKITLKVLKLLQRILDVSPYMKQTLINTAKNFKKYQEGKVTESQQIILKISTKQLQNLIINQGFFEIFLSFCEQFNSLYRNYQSNIQQIKQKLFYQFLITTCKLIRGPDSANLHAQKAFFQLLINNNSNALLSILQQNFTKQFEMNEIQKIHYNIRSEIKRVPLSIDKDQLFENYDSVRSHWGKLIVITQIEFIQLLAEDHFRPFQDFFREQPDFPKSINILNQIQQILLNMFSQESFQVFSHDDYRLIISCFDCIKELIQGPCPQNQRFFCQPTFLRLCYKILNYDDSQKTFLNLYQKFSKQQINENRSRKATQNELINQQSFQAKNQIQQTYIEFYQDCPIYCSKLLKSFQTANNQNFRLYMLSEIKFRCAQTLESLTDDENNLTETLNNITQIINEKVLIRNITNQYVKFKILHSSGKNYTNGIFSHLLEGKQKLLQQQETKDNEKWSLEEKVTISLAIKDFCDSFIIETGFSLFNILAQVYQNNNKDTLQRIYEQIDLEKSKKKKFKSILLYNFYQSFYSLQLITERITGNFMSEKQKQSINQKIFTPYKSNKTEEDSNLQEKKLGYRALRFYATRSGSIEVVLPTKAIKQVIFPLVPHCFALNQQIKDKFLIDLDLSSQQAKLESVLYNSNKVIQKLQTEYKFQAIYKRYLIVNLIASNQEAWKQVIFYVIVFQNLMIILTSNGNYDPILDSLLLILNILQIVLQFVCFFIFLIRKLPYLKIKSKEIVYERNINRIRKREIKYKYLDQSQSIVQQEDFILERTDKFLLEQNPFLRFYFTLSDGLVLYKYVFLDYEMIYFLIFTTLAVIGLQYKPVLALLLLDVFWRFPMLAAIIHSVWRPMTSILLLLASFFLLQYYYSLLIYNFYSEDSNYSQYCNNFQQCFSFILDVTFKKDSGAPGYVAINGSVYENPDFRYGILNFWEFCYYFFAISLVYSIFTGLILDSFGTDREEAQEFQTAIEEYCLICGIDKGLIEKKAIHKKGFRFHSKYEHSVWNYLFFISYLQGKKKSEYNGIESYVSDQLKKESIQWLPINLSLSIPEQDQDQIDEKIEDKLTKISHSIEERSKKGKK